MRRRIALLGPLAVIASVAIWQALITNPHGLTCPVPGSGPNGRALYGVPPWGCTGPVHWILHGLGIDSQIGYFYDTTSGVGPMLETLLLSIGVLFSAYLAYRNWSCQYSFWCPRHAQHPLTDPDTGETHTFCHRHHPGERHHRWSPAHIEDVWHRHLASRARPS